MEVVESKEALRARLNSLRRNEKTIGFVPTMGALHAGHLSLVERSRKENDVTVMSIFVNPMQFGPKEDFANYPRTIEKDRALSLQGGVDFLFYPSVDEMVPEGTSTRVEESRFSLPLCGPFRPGHFSGVATIVLKLLQITNPTVLYLGEKDAQQLRVVEKMVEDLDLSVRVVGCPTAREPDGLAMSSRNAYLSPMERERAPLLYAALQKGRATYESGEQSSKNIVALVREAILISGAFELQYLELLRWRDFGPIDRIDGKVVLAVAAYLGKTRLIDNILFGDH